MKFLNLIRTITQGCKLGANFPGSGHLISHFLKPASTLKLVLEGRVQQSFVAAIRCSTFKFEK